MEGGLNLKTLTFNKFDEEAEKTDEGDSAQRSMGHPWMYYVLGVVGEAGELAEKVKKLYRDHDGILTEEQKILILKEIGDVLWYQSRLAEKLGSSLGEVAQMNIIKLKDRKKRKKLHGNGDER